MPETVLERMAGQLGCSTDEASYKWMQRTEQQTGAERRGLLSFVSKDGASEARLVLGPGLAAGDTVDNRRGAAAPDKRDETS